MALSDTIISEVVRGEIERRIRDAYDTIEEGRASKKWETRVAAGWEALAKFEKIRSFAHEDTRAIRGYGEASKLLGWDHVLIDSYRTAAHIERTPDAHLLTIQKLDALGWGLRAHPDIVAGLELAEARKNPEDFFAVASLGRHAMAYEFTELATRAQQLLGDSVKLHPAPVNDTWSRYTEK